MNNNKNNEKGLTYRLNRLAFGLFVLAGMSMFNPDASAQLSWSGSVGGAPNVAGVQYANFDSMTAGIGGTDVTTDNSNLTLTFQGTAMVANGTLSGAYAAPYIYNNNGVLFGNNQANGPDVTNYLTAGIDSVTMMFSSPQYYLGILWGSVDSYNTLSFYNGKPIPANLIGSITGSDILAGANGDQGYLGTLYENINSTTAFTSVVATSSQYAFEFDNVAFASFPVGVPEPATYALLLSGLLTAGLFKNSRKVTA